MECEFLDETSKVKVTGCQKITENWRHVYLRAADQTQAAQAPTANYAYAIVTPNLLSAPEHETISNWTHGRICQCFLVIVACSQKIFPHVRCVSKESVQTASTRRPEHWRRDQVQTVRKHTSRPSSLCGTPARQERAIRRSRDRTRK